MDICIPNLIASIGRDIGLDSTTVHYVRHRFLNEGVRFLTVTLPKLEKAVMSSLEKGYFDRPTDFAWKGKSLRYFSKFLNKIFDEKTGLVLTTPDSYSIYAIRQFCLYFYKLSLPVLDEKLNECEEKFLACDESLPVTSSDYDYAWVDQLRKDCETHFSELHTKQFHEILRSHNPRSGPGTYAFWGRGDFNLPWYLRKHVESTYHTSYPGDAWAVRHLKRPPRWFTNHEEQTRNIGRACSEAFVSEVLFVPKDSRGPRTIVREPYTQLQYQMSYNDYMVSMLERTTCNRINFRDQSVNGKLAELSSMTREYATLDLKDASDRVSVAIIRHIFRNSPLRHFLKYRSTHTILPSGKCVELRKLAGMGSGLTFPTMSLLISLTIVRMISNRTGLDYKQVQRNVYVYGDDIIVPRSWYTLAIEALNKVFLRINPDKSFIHSRFRESCGYDFFNGNDVTPIRLKLQNSDNRVCKNVLRTRGDFSLLALERHCRELVKGGLLHTAELLYSVIERKYGKLPEVSGESPVIGRYVLESSRIDYPTDETGAYCTVKAIVPTPQKESQEEKANQYIFLKKCLTRRGDTALERLFGNANTPFGLVEVPRRLVYKRRKVSAFRLLG